MIEKAHRRQHDSTLAVDLQVRLKNPTVYSILRQHYPSETTQLLMELRELDHSAQGNKVDIILALISDYSEKCQQNKKVSNDLMQHIYTFLDPLLHELNALNKNIHANQVTITCALDGYTLNRTCHLVEKIASFIDKHQQPLDFKRQTWGYPSSSSMLKPAFLSFKTKQADKAEISTAKTLLDFCIQLRNEIGSPETKPKGQVINFMVILCDLKQSPTLPAELSQIIEHEVASLYRFYPKLAAAGEKLQKAIANNQMQKP